MVNIKKREKVHFNYGSVNKNWNIFGNGNQICTKIELLGITFIPNLCSESTYRLSYRYPKFEKANFSKKFLGSRRQNFALRQVYGLKLHLN